MPPITKPKLETTTLNGVELLAVGRWKGHNCPKDGCEFTRKMLDQLVTAYDATKDSLQAPVKLGHNDEQALLQADGLPAAGWVTNLRRDGDRLLGDLEKVPSAVADLMAAGAYRTRSAELMPNLDVAGETYPLVFTGLALLGEDLPAVQGLADITALYNSLHLSLDKDTRAIVFSLPDGISYNDLQEHLRQALKTRFPSQTEWSPWVTDLYDSTVIFCDSQSRYWQADYTIDGETVTLGEPVAVERVTTWRPALQMMAAAADDEDENYDLAAELETFLARLDSRMKGQKGMPVMRAFLRETTGKLRALQNKRRMSQEDGDMDEKALRTALGLADDADILEAITALKAKAETPAPATTEVAALKTELSQTTARLLTIEGQRADEQAEAKVSAAIRLGQLIPAQKDVAKKMYLLSAEDFDTFVASQPKRLEFGERGVETDESAVTLSSAEQVAAKALGVTSEAMIASKKLERERVGV